MIIRKSSIKEFGRKKAVGMFEEMVTWLSEHQVAKRGDPNRGAIYFPTEDRFCNRDTACMARAFMRQHLRTGDMAWRQKASLARDHVLSVQKPNGGYPELRGRKQSDDGSTVNTSLVAANLIKAYELGLDCQTRDLAALEKMADFELTLEWKPGAFYHDTNHRRTFKDQSGTIIHWGEEGSHRDCQNTTALASMMLQRIYYYLAKHGGKPKQVWLSAAGRAIKHLLAGQDRDGQWPYCVGDKWKDAGHHAMCMQYLVEAAAYPPHNRNRSILSALRRAAVWLSRDALLQTKKGTKINWAVNNTACLYFTAEYFFIASALTRFANMDDSKNGDIWRHEALELMRYVRTDLWNNAQRDNEGPFRLTEAGIKIGYAWFGQSMGWCVYTLDDLIEGMGWWKLPVNRQTPRP